MLTHGNRGDGQQLVSKEGVSKQLKYPKDWTKDPPSDMRYYAQKLAEKSDLAGMHALDAKAVPCGTDMEEGEREP